MQSESCKELLGGKLLFDGTCTNEPGRTFPEFRSGGTGATFEKDSLIVSFECCPATGTTKPAVYLIDDVSVREIPE